MKRIAQLTDLHLDDRMAIAHAVDTRANLLQVLDDVCQKGITEAVLTGDLGEDHTIGWLRTQLDNRGIHASYLFGNHDSHSNYQNLPDFSGHFHPEGYYHARVEEGFLQLFMDSSHGWIGPDQMAWLQDACTGTDSPILLFIHHPLLDCDDSPMDRFFPLRGRNALRDWFLALGRPVSIFCGHYHCVHDQSSGFMEQHVTYSTYVQIKTTGETLDMDGRHVGYRILELDSGSLHTRSVTVPPSGLPLHRDRDIMEHGAAGNPSR